MSVKVVNIESIEWQAVPNTWAGKVVEGEPDVRFKLFQTGSSAVPMGQLIEYQPGHVEGRHSHEEGEIYYMLDGELTIGNDVLKSGMLVHIEGGTEYGPSRTDVGCRFLRLGLA